MEQSTLRIACRGCGQSKLESVLTLGRQLVTGFTGVVRRAPLELVLCRACSLVQLGHSVPQSWFREWYGYRSGINPSMVSALSDVAMSGTLAAGGLNDGDLVVDIGANDGTLLSMFEKLNQRLQLLGFEPAKNLWEFFESNAPGSVLVKEPFPSGKAKEFFPPYPCARGARLVTAVAMFYDIEEPGAFLSAVRDILAPDGVFVVQMNGLLQMVESCAFDNISHEHNCYYSLGVFIELAEKSGLEVFDVQENQVNGGSFRAYLRRSRGTGLEAWMGNHRVKEMLDREARAGLADVETYREMSRRMGRYVGTLRSFLMTCRAAGKKVGVYGASTRGLVILESMNLGEGVLCCAAERNKEKVGMQYSGTEIQCVSEETARELCQSFLVLPYHFIEGIVDREIEFIKSGGELIVPLPVPSVYYWDRETDRLCVYRLV